MTTLADLERETASRLGPFYDLTATGGTATGVVVETLRTNTEPGGLEGLYLLRRDAQRTADRVRTVERVDGPSGSLVVDFPYEDTPLPGERVELHHLHPDLQLLADVRAALRRCYLLDVLAVTPPPDPLASFAVVGRATIRELNADEPRDGAATGGWLVYPPNGNGNGFDPGPFTAGDGRRVLASWAGVTDRSPRAGPPGSVVDLTMQAPWLTAARQVLAVAVDGVRLPPAGRYGEPSGQGWTCYATRGRVYLGIPVGVPLDGLTVRAYRDAFGLVDDVDTPEGPQHDDDELAVPLDYAAAFAHIEAWRRHRDRLEAAAAEGRFPTQVEASTEATRVAAIYADFLFRPHTERGDRPAPPVPVGSTGGANGLGGSGALAGAVVNQNNPYE